MNLCKQNRLNTNTLAGVIKNLWFTLDSFCSPSWYWSAI